MSEVTDLTEKQIKAVRQVIGRTPDMALPHSGMGVGRDPKTVEQLIEIMDSMRQAILKVMGNNQQLRHAADAELRDMLAAGRVIRRMLASGTANYTGTEEGSS